MPPVGQTDPRRPEIPRLENLEQLPDTKELKDIIIAQEIQQIRKKERN